jgi:ABC-type bacteriocin/lantibiotic exporter with double-glycine peptidase domain
VGTEEWLRATVKAVQNANLDLFPGQVTALVGESGSGKSTISKMILPFISISSGAINYNGVDISTL